MKLETNYEAGQATLTVQTMANVQAIADSFVGRRVLYEDPAPWERPPADVIYPALVRQRLDVIFDDAERAGLDRIARVALQTWALATVNLDGHPIAPTQSKSND